MKTCNDCNVTLDPDIFRIVFRAGDAYCRDCADKVTLPDGTVGHDYYDPHSEPLPSDEECERMQEVYYENLRHLRHC